MTMSFIFISEHCLVMAQYSARCALTKGAFTPNGYRDFLRRPYPRGAQALRASSFVYGRICWNKEDRRDTHLNQALTVFF